MADERVFKLKFAVEVSAPAGASIKDIAECLANKIVWGSDEWILPDEERAEPVSVVVFDESGTELARA